MRFLSFIICCFLAVVVVAADVRGNPCSDAFSLGEGQQIHSPTPNPPRLYFIMTRLFADGTLDAIASNIPHLASLGITELWISPVHEQTTMFANGEPNNHMYWPSDPASVAAMLGGWEAFQRLMDIAKQYGIRICLDVVLDQAGFGEKHLMRYEENGQWTEKWIYASDPAYFRHRQLDPSIYGRLNYASDPAEVIALLRELATQQWHPYLPVYNHENPEIYQWLFQSYKAFAQAGVRWMRLDAYKHIPLEFTGRFMREISDYVANISGERMTFLIEHVTNSYEQLRVLNDITHDQTRDQNPEILFLDFPKAFELVRLSQDLGYGLNHFRGFIDYRENPAHNFPLAHLVGDITNHDFMPPIPHHFNHQLTLALSDFFGNVPTIIYHGDEQTGKRLEMRAWIPDVNPHGDVGYLSKVLNNALTPYRASPDFNRTIWHTADFDVLVAEKRVGNRSIVMAVSRKSETFGNRIYFDRKLRPGAQSLIFNFGGANIRSADNADHSIDIQFDGQSIAIFEVEFE